MAKVKALYSYTYDYEGSKISFKSGDEFQLLAKVNTDWWHVRRWVNEGCAQDIYIPAVYVKEVGTEDSNPVYQNMAELKKQVDDFKKKASSTPPPPTARKPRHDRAGSEKNKAVAMAASIAVVSGNISENKVGGTTAVTESAPATESVADIAKKLAETMQGKKVSDGEEGGGGVGVKGGTNMPLVAPKRSQSTRRLESPSSPRHGRKLPEGATNLPPVASKPRSYSINTRPTENRRENEMVNRRESESVSPPELVLQHGEPPPLATAKSALAAKAKQPPPVLPKGGKLHRPKSMVMFSPTEDGEGGKEDPFAASFQTQLSEQMKKMKSASTVGASSSGGVGVVGGAEPKTTEAVSEERAEQQPTAQVCVCVHMRMRERGQSIH